MGVFQSIYGISVFNAFSYKNASRFSNIEITKNGQCFGTVRFVLLRKISVKTEER
jgi:hypothetical protein